MFLIILLKLVCIVMQQLALPPSTDFPYQFPCGALSMCVFSSCLRVQSVQKGFFFSVSGKQWVFKRRPSETEKIVVFFLILL